MRVHSSRFFGYSALNESPSEKEGKSSCAARAPKPSEPSMKVPPKRKGNRRDQVGAYQDS